MIPDLLVQDPPVRDDDNRGPPLGGSLGALGDSDVAGGSPRLGRDAAGPVVSVSPDGDSDAVGGLAGTVPADGEDLVKECWIVSAGNRRWQGE